MAEGKGNIQTETKLAIDKNGDMVKTEIPVFKMPTELRNPNFKPEGRLLLVDYIPVENPKAKDVKDSEGKIVGQIYIPDSVKSDKAPKGLVLAVGNLVDGYSRGDMVTYKPNPQASFMVEIEGSIYLLIEQFSLLGKYTNQNVETESK